jgi:hypothetical protein
MFFQLLLMFIWDFKQSVYNNNNNKQSVYNNNKQSVCNNNNKQSVYNNKNVLWMRKATTMSAICWIHLNLWLFKFFHCCSNYTTGL